MLDLGQSPISDFWNRVLWYRLNDAENCDKVKINWNLEIVYEYLITYVKCVDNIEVFLKKMFEEVRNEMSIS